MLGVWLLTVAVLSFAGSSPAATVSYIAGDELWLSNPAGTQKKKLSGPAGDGRVWTEQAQADNGKIVAVRREPGKVAQLNSFTLFGPSGTVIQQGSLTHESGWTSYAYPVSLDLTDGGVAVYGFSNYNPTFPNWTFVQGTYVRTVEQPFVLEPLELNGWEWPTLFGERLVATQGQEVWLQAPGNGRPFTPDPDVGFLAIPDGYTINRTDVAANGKLFGIELDYKTIELYPITGVPNVTPGPGENIVGSGGCVLPTQGDAGQITISQDGKDIAWEDDRGVVSAGVPDFSGADPCHLTRPPVVLATNGKYPSIGNASLSTGGGGGGGGGVSAPVPSVPAKVKAAGLRKGIWITIKVAKAGPVSISGKVKGKLVARGSGKARKSGKVKIKLVATAAWRNRLARLKGKALVIKVTANGKSKTVRRVLK